MAYQKYSDKMSSIISLIAILCVALHFQCSNAVKGGYWFPGSAVPDPADIDSTLFTHLFCAFAKLNTQTNQLTIPPKCSTFSQTVKQKNPSVKTLLSIGGGAVSSSIFNAMASQPSSRKTFIDSSINLALTNKFDGLDLDWEHQTMEVEMNNLKDLLNEWKTAIKSQAPNLLLTAALNVKPQVNPSVTFPIQAITNNLDWVNVMAYDFIYDPNQPPTSTRAPAALNNPSADLSGSSGISAWIKAGVPANKLVLGLPFYGYAWNLVNPNNHGVLAQATGLIKSVDDISSDGAISYTSIVKDFISKGAKVEYDSAYVTNYCYSGTTWIGYDDKKTISAKVNYAKNTANLLGYFAWSIGQDNDWALSKQASQTWQA